LLVSDIENGLFVLRDHAQALRQNVGRVGFSEPAISTTEGSISVAVRVRRVLGSAGAVSVQFAAGTPSVGIGAPATEGADYTAASGTLTWGDGDLADKIAIVPLIDDTSIEGVETFTVTLSAASGGAVLDGASTLTISLTDNDTAAPPSGGGGGGGGGAFDLILLAWLVSVALARVGVLSAKPPRGTEQ
jgi:hypothetical protein